MTDDHARKRFFAINLIRFTGLAMVLASLAIHYRKIDAPDEVAWALAALGMVEFFFVPKFLARRWRTPRP